MVRVLPVVGRPQLCLLQAAPFDLTQQRRDLGAAPEGAQARDLVAEPRENALVLALAVGHLCRGRSTRPSHRDRGGGGVHVGQDVDDPQPALTAAVGPAEQQERIADRAGARVYRTGAGAFSISE